MTSRDRYSVAAARRSRPARAAFARPLPARACEPLESRVLLAATPTLLHDINRTTDMLAPASFTAVGSTAFFTGHASAMDGRELFKTDGTAAGTVLVKDIAPGIKSSQPGNLTNVNGTLFFAAADADGDKELWKSDGTEANTVRVRNINPAASSAPASFCAVGNLLYFVADAGAGPTLFRSDGTEAGTVAVPGVPSSPDQLTAFAGGLLFTSGASSRVLHRIDAAGALTAVNTALDARAPFVLGGSAYFFAGAVSGNTPGDLYRTDGTPSGTTFVKAIDYPYNGTDGAIVGPWGYDRPVFSGNLAYFRLGDRFGKYDLWRTDGTAAGTVALTTGGTLGAFTPLSPVGVNSVLFAFTTAARGREPWVSNGTVAGTQILDDLASFEANGLDPAFDLAAVRIGAYSYFASNRVTGDGSIWRTDGSPGRTTKVADIVETPGHVLPVGAVNGLALWTVARSAGTGELFRSDGTAAGTYRIGATTPAGATANGIDKFSPGPSSPAFARSGDRVYFSATDGLTGHELWRSDPAAGAVRVADLAPGGESSDPRNFTVADDGTLYFTAYTPAAGREIYRLTPGSGVPQMLPEVTRGNLYPATAQSAQDLAPVGSLLYFRHGSSLYRYDAVTGDSAIVTNAAGRSIAYPGEMARAGDAWYFAAQDFDTGLGAELYRIDASPNAVPQLVKDVFPGPNHGSPGPLGAVGSSLLFAANDGYGNGGAGIELWITDGTADGTRRVADMSPGTASTYFEVAPEFGRATAGGVLYFVARAEGAPDLMPWRTDGTAAGTYPLGGGSVTRPKQITAAGGHALFTASEPATPGFSDRALYRTADTDGDGVDDGLVALSGAASTGLNTTAFHVAPGGRVFALGYAGAAQTAGLTLWQGTTAPGSFVEVDHVLPYVSTGPHLPPTAGWQFNAGIWAMASTDTDLYLPAYDPVAGWEPHRLNFVPGTVTPSWLAAGSAATWDAGTRTLNVTGAATITADPGADAPLVTAGGAAAVLTIDPPAGTRMTLAGLRLSDNASAAVNAAGAERVLVIADGAGLALDATATLDLGDNALVVRNAGSPAASASTHASVNHLVRGAFHDFAWDLPGITSSAVRADVADGRPATLGILLNNDGAGGALFYGEGAATPTFLGATVGANTVMVRFTRLGDGDLNGTVDTVDFALFQAGYTNSAPYVGFAFGDYDYNGVIDTVDFGLFQAGYQSGGGGVSAAGEDEDEEQLGIAGTSLAT